MIHLLALGVMEGEYLCSDWYWPKSHSHVNVCMSQCM